MKYVLYSALVLLVYQHKCVAQPELSQPTEGSSTTLSLDITKRLSAIQNVYFEGVLKCTMTPLGAKIAQEEDLGLVQKIGFSADRGGRYVVDLDYLEPKKLQGQGSKTAFNGKILQMLYKSNRPILSIRSKDKNDNVLITGINPLLEGIGFLTPKNDSEENPTGSLRFSELVNPDLIASRLAQIDPNSLKIENGLVKFEISGGIKEKRRFKYEIEISTDKAFPQVVQRRAIDDNSVITRYEVKEWKEIAASDGFKVWAPVRMVETVYNDEGKVLIVADAHIDKIEINRDFRQDHFDIPLSEADVLHDEDKNVTINLKDSR